MKTGSVLAIVAATGMVATAGMRASAQTDGGGQDPVSGEGAAAQASPCKADEKFREFDFWLGEWEVRDASGKVAGKNVIEAAHGGCVLIENWTGAGGTTGMSINYFDDDKGEWVQHWIDNSGGQIEIRGGLTDEGMLLSGSIHYASNDTTAPFRGLWTRLPDGRVRQFFEQSNDGGETWQPWFEGFYSRVDGMSGAARAETGTN